MTRKKATLITRRAVTHLRKRKTRMKYSLVLGAAFVVLWIVFHHEIFKFFSELSTMPVMEAFFAEEEE